MAYKSMLTTNISNKHEKDITILGMTNKKYIWKTRNNTILVSSLLTKKMTQSQAFCKIFPNSFLTELLRVSASESNVLYCTAPASALHLLLTCLFYLDTSKRGCGTFDSTKVQRDGLHLTGSNRRNKNM